MCEKLMKCFTRDELRICCEIFENCNESFEINIPKEAYTLETSPYTIRNVFRILELVDVIKTFKLKRDILVKVYNRKQLIWLIRKYKESVGYAKIDS